MVSDYSFIIDVLPLMLMILMDLFELIVLEILFLCVATYISEEKAKNAAT